MGVNPVRRRLLRLPTLALFGGIARWGGASRAFAGAKPKVAIIGGGFAGSRCALFLKRLRPIIDVTLIDPDEHYVTCPMSNSVLVGLRSMASITVSRRGLERAGVTVVRDHVIAVDVGRRRVGLGGGTVLAYDTLVLAAGIRFLWGKPEGYDEGAAQLMPHAWQAGAQTKILAAQLRAMDDGGVAAISVPAGPMRCPPGPFERASLIASYFKRYKPRSKVLIFDANNHFPRQDVFTQAWETLYPRMIEWIPVVNDGAVVRVDPAQMTLFTSDREHRVDVANIIPAQAPALLAVASGMAAPHGWCPVHPESFASSLVSNVHVIGDACIADPLPKSASAASGQAKQCALSIAAAFGGRPAPDPTFRSVCYSMLAPDRALSIHGRFRWHDGRVLTLPETKVIEGRAGSAAFAAQEAQNAADWYRGIVADSFGV